jgi:hypothetical protein
MTVWTEEEVEMIPVDGFGVIIMLSDTFTMFEVWRRGWDSDPIEETVKTLGLSHTYLLVVTIL